MAIIKPFKGIRPPQDLVEQVASRPYDVLNSAEAREEAKGNEKSLYHIIKPEIDFPVGTDEHDECVYQKAAENFQMFQDKGWLVQDDKENYYVYAQTMNGKTQYGLVVGAYVPDYMNGVIKKHELTRRDKEEDRMKHVRVNNANIEPVFFAYPDNATLDAIIAHYTAEKPVYDFTSEDGVQHTLHVVENLMEIAELTRLFEDVPVMYIADGHHRSAAAMRVADELGKTPRHGSNEEYSTFLAVIFPDNMMQIMDYNRLVKDLNGLSMEEFLSRVGEKFEISELENGPKPEARHQFSMYLTGKWRRLTAKEGTFAADDVIGSLDVSILQDNLLAPLLGIKDPRTDERINFMGGIRGLDALAAKVDAGAYSVAIAMYPTSMEELIKVADAGKIMPPKSTWFEPKLRDAMVVHLIGEDE